MIRLVVICILGTALCSPASAARVDVPLTLDGDYLATQVASVLGIGEDGPAVLSQDRCNRMALSEPRVESLESRLELWLTVAADMGVQMMGSCVGPGRWDGLMRIELTPRVHASGKEIRFQPETAEFLRPDGSTSLLTGATRMLAESLVLPRIGELRADLAESLAALDELLLSLRPAAAAPARRPEPTLIGAAAVVPGGLRVTLALDAGEPAPAAAVPEAPLAEEELGEWQRLEDELDGFLTTIIVSLAGGTDDPDLQRDLVAVLLDARWAINEALARDQGPGEPDPVRRLFVDAWEQLRPHVARFEHEEFPGDDSGLRLAGFLSGGDAIRALDELGPGYGLEITRDGLRRLARLLLSDQAPARFTPLPLAIDPSLRRLFPMDPGGLITPEQDASRLLDWLFATARADGGSSPAHELRGMVPRLANLDEYLHLVSRLMDQAIETRLGGGTRVPEQFRFMLDPLVRATAWKESCWRQYAGSSDQPRVLTSSVGALGMMQIHARVWRGIYDLDLLADDVEYNLNAGIDILEYYLVDYALRRGEHEQPGGLENLPRATYAAYNGGPSHLGRYRRDDTSDRLRSIDREFWAHYETMRTEGWPNVGSCYAVSGSQ